MLSIFQIHRKSSRVDLIQIHTVYVLDREAFCWAATTEYFIGKKEVMNCMTYFPVIYKTSDIIETRIYIEKLHQKPFDEVWRGSYKYCYEPCQYSIICNYLWYFRRDDYDWHFIEMGGFHPNKSMGPRWYPNKGIWHGEGRKPQQVSAEYIQNLNKTYKIPKHRVAIHARHFIDRSKNEYLDVRNTAVNPTASQLRSQLRQGLCLSFGLRKCPDHCKDISNNDLQDPMYSFEDYEWFFDEKRCLLEQAEHYQLVEKFLNYHNIQPSCSLFHALSISGEIPKLPQCTVKLQFISLVTLIMNLYTYQF